MAYATDPTEEAPVIKKKVLITFIISLILLTISAVSFVTDPILVMTNQYSRVDYGTAVHQILTSETDSVHLSAYLFNITNADRFLSGEDRNLKVQEVGPFTYQENRTNDEVTIDKERGVLKFIPRHKVTFLPEESVGRPEDMRVVMPNVAMLGMASRLSSYSYLVQLSFNLLATRLNSKPIINMTAQDYLWGYDEPLIKVGNTLLPGWIDFSKFGLLDRLYDKNKTYKFEVSIRNADKFAVKTVNGLGGLQAWQYEDPEKRSRCNSFTDVYEGVAYPPAIQSSRPLRIYRPILCRFFDLDYLGTKRTQYGTEALSYRVSNRTYSKIPENDCLCSNGICGDGFSDMSPCFYGLPAVLSNAHFMEADPSVYDRIEGMTPNEEVHGSDFTIDPFMGIVLTTKFSVQVNVLLGDVNFNTRAKKFSNMMVPIAYVKIVQPKLQPEQIATIKFIRVYAPYILLGVQLLLIVVGLLCLSRSARILYWNCIRPRRKGIALELTTTELEIAKAAKVTEPLMNQ